MKQVKKTTQKNKSHGLFFSLLKNVPGYDPQYRDVIKEGIVSQYTKGKTESLSVMYERFPREYSKMINEMKGDSRQKEERRQSELEIARCRVLAAGYEWLEKSGYKPTRGQTKADYIKGAACRACNCSNFNLIDLPSLQKYYGWLCKQNRVSPTSLQVLSKPSKN